MTDSFSIENVNQHWGNGRISFKLLNLFNCYLQLLEIFEITEMSNCRLFSSCTSHYKRSSSLSTIELVNIKSFFSFYCHYLSYSKTLATASPSPISKYLHKGVKVMQMCDQWESCKSCQFRLLLMLYLGEGGFWGILQGTSRYLQIK